MSLFGVILSLNIGMSQNWQLEDLSVVHKFEDMEYIFHHDNDTTYLINFWATWCKPCVEEMPYIDPLTEKYKDEKFKIILVSLDFKKQLESKLIPYLNKNKIQSEVIVLADSKTNKWIDKVDPKWSGAIPITLVYKGQERFFYEENFHSLEEVEKILIPFLE